MCWKELMGQQLRGMDQHNHPICISTTLEPEKEWRGLSEMEHVEWTAARDFAAGGKALEEKFAGVNFSLRQWAADARGPKRPRKPWGVMAFGSAQSRADAQIASIMAGLPMAPLLPSDPKMPLSAEERAIIRSASVFGAALAEISSADSREELQPIEVASGTARLYARAGRRGIAAWILAQGATQSLEFKLPGLSEGSYRISWMDPRTGAFLSSEEYQAPPQMIEEPVAPLKLKTPAFEREIAVFIVRK